MECRKPRYVLTPRRLAASRANILKAIAARKTPEGNAAARLNALKHGLFARRVEDSVRRLKEDPKEFAAHCRLFERYYAPQDDEERRFVRRLAETTWRRLRLFRAQALWETERLHGLFAAAPRAAKLSVYHTENRAYALVHLLNRFTALLREATKIESQVERWLRRLLRKRSDGKVEFKVLCPRRESRILEEEPSFTELVDRFLDLLPDERAAVLRQAGYH